MLELAAVGEALKGQLLLVCGLLYLPLAGKAPIVMFLLACREGNSTELHFRSTFKKVHILFYQKVLPFVICRQHMEIC